MEEKKEQKKRNRPPEATVMNDNFLLKAIREGNCTEIKWRQAEMEYLYDLFD